MKKFLLKTIIITIVLLTFLLGVNVNAATVTADKQEVKAGETITLTVTPSEARDGVQFNLDYDKTVFEISGVTAENNLSTEYSNETGKVMAYSSGEQTTSKVTVTLKALKDANSSTITVKDFVSGTEEVTTVGSVNVKVNKAEEDKPDGSDTSIDVSKIKASIGRNKSGIYEFSITGLPSDKDLGVYVTNGKNAPTVPNESLLGKTDWHYYSGSMHAGKLTFDVYDLIEKSGDIYMWIYEEKYNASSNSYTHTNLISAQKIERPAQKTLGNRMMCYFHTDKTASTVKENLLSKDRKINLKIGVINDINILKSIKNGEANCLSKLLNYAKTSKSIYTGSIPAQKDCASITNKMKLVDEAYYYVYMTLDDENGKYYPVEDVSLYQALVSSDKEVYALYDYLDSNFKWNLKDDGGDSKPIDINTNNGNNKGDDNTTASGKLPQTGFSIAIVASIIVVAILAVVGAVQYKRYNIKY